MNRPAAPTRLDPPGVPAPLLLAGPTGVGKSAVAILAAERLGGEIVSVDSMQVYRGMDIGTAKPGPAERARVPHHLIDVAGLDETFDAGRFVELALPAIRAIQSRGRVPILCGGTGLYFKALLEGLGDTPAADPALRAQLEATPLPDLLEELAARDPDAWNALDRKNPRRIIRALEVIRLTGRTFSSQRTGWVRPEDRSAVQPVLMIGFSRAAEDLFARIRQRVEAMIEAGWLEETRALYARGLAGNRNAQQAIGYAQILEHLRYGRPLAQTIEEIQIRSRQYAKRQLAWFRRQAAPEWTTLAPEEPPDQTAERCAARYEAAVLQGPEAL